MYRTPRISTRLYKPSFECIGIAADRLEHRRRDTHRAHRCVIKGNWPYMVYPWHPDMVHNAAILNRVFVSLLRLSQLPRAQPSHGLLPSEISSMWFKDRARRYPQLVPCGHVVTCVVLVAVPSRIHSFSEFIISWERYAFFLMEWWRRTPSWVSEWVGWAFHITIHDLHGRCVLRW